MEIKPEKKQFSKQLTHFHLRLQLELGKKVGIQELAEMIGVSAPQISRWMKTNQNILPGGPSTILLINFFVDYFGEEALVLYDTLGWERPRVSKRGKTT